MPCRCKSCKRVLKTPASIQAGYGPVCKKRDDKQGKLFTLDELEECKNKRKQE